MAPVRAQTVNAALKILRTLQVIEFLSEEPPQRGTLRLQREKNRRRGRKIQTCQPGQISAPVDLKLGIKSAILWGRGCRGQCVLALTLHPVCISLGWCWATISRKLIRLSSVNSMSVEFGRTHCREEDFIC